MNKLYYTLLLLLLSTSFSQNTNCEHPDFPALVALNNAISGLNWDFSDCDICNLEGITCNQNGRVSRLVRPNSNLSGFLPSEIGELVEIEELILSNNFLTGIIPKELGNLNNGFQLILENNQLSGNLPAELVNFGSQRVFPSLEITGGINVSDNRLSGCYPESYRMFCTSLFSFISTNNENLPFGGNFANLCTSGLGTEDLDNDGICNSEDCDDNNPTLPNTPNSRCDDGNPNTINDTVGEDGCTCIGQPISGGSVNCDLLQFSPENNQITVTNVAPSSIIEIIGRNTDWQIVPICNGDCAVTQIIPDLMAGEYIVKVQLFGQNGSFCFREETVEVTSSENGNTGGSGGSNEETANCDALTFTSENGAVTVTGLTANYDRVEIIGKNTGYQVITICDGDCSDNQLIMDLAEGAYTVKVNQGGADGTFCYREEIVMVTRDGNTSGGSEGTADCDALTFTPANSSITVTGLTADYDRVEIIGQNTDYQVITICESDSNQPCSETQIISDLANGTYTVKINQGGANGMFCYREENVIITNSSSSRNSTIANDKELVLYPNPVKDRLNLKFKRLADKEGIIYIYDTFGKMIASFPKVPNNEVVSIDLDGYENGMYLLSVKASGLPMISKRFIVEHLR